MVGIALHWTSIMECKMGACTLLCDLCIRSLKILDLLKGSLALFAKSNVKKKYNTLYYVFLFKCPLDTLHLTLLLLFLSVTLIDFCLIVFAYIFHQPQY